MVRFRDALAADFDRRRDGRPTYSLRRFARYLGVNHGTLSRLLRGSRPIPSRTVRLLGSRIGLSAGQIATFSTIEDIEAVVVAIGRAGFRPDSRWLASVA